jgi:two-component system cell cycle sensor histidine kinase/response regulator CckA
MKDRYKTKKQLIEELEGLRNQLVEPKKAEGNRKRVEETLQTTNERLNYLLTSTSAAIYTAKTSGDYGTTFITENVKRMTGYEPREFIENASFWIDRVHPEDRERILNELPHIFEQESYIYEYRFLYRDGNYRWVRDDMKLIKDEFGNPIEIIGYWIDITERRKAEEKLRETEKRYRAVVEISPDGIAIASKGRHVFANQSLARILGVSDPDELLGKPVMDYIHPDYRKIVRERIETQTKRGVLAPLIEKKMIRADGTVIHTEVAATSLEYQGEEAVLAIVRDITNRKQAEKELRESEERFRLAFENANTGVCLVDLDGNLTRVNNKMCEIFGYTKEELERMTVNDIAHPEDIDVSPAFIQKTLRGETDRGTFEKRYFHKKGHVVTCQVSSSLVRDAKGSPLYFISHVHDATDRKRAEAQIEWTLRETRVRFEVSQALAGTQTEDGVLDALIQHAGLYPQAFVVIFTLDRRGGELAAIVRRQNPFESGLTTVVSIGGGLPVSRYTLFGRLSADQPFVSGDVWADERIEPAGREILGQTGAASFAMFPLTVGSEWMGLILAMAKPTNYFDEEKQHLFQTLAEQGVVALRAARLREQIRDSQQRFKGLVETLSDWIWEIDQNGVYTYVSPRVRGLLRYEPEELVGKTPFDLMPPEEAERVKPIFESLLAARQPLVALENTCRHKDGRLVVFETSGAPFFDADGQFKGYRGVDRDITEHKKAGEALRQSEERYRTILEDIEDGYFEVDLTGRFTFLNDSMCRIHGYPREEFWGTDNRRFVDKENAKKAFEAFNQVYRTGEPGRLFDYEVIRKDGTKRQVEVFPSLRRNSSGKPIGFRGIVRDITERKQAEELLRKEREISLSILENAPYGVALIDKGGRYIYINPEFTNITGYTLPDIPTGKDWFQKAFPDPKDRERMIQVWKEDRSKRKMMNREFGIHCKDAKIKEIEIRSTFLKDGRALIVLHDITEQKRAEERMESLQEQLRQSQKMEAIGRLAGGIAHDFNNLLTIIKGYSQLSLIELKENAPLRENIEHIHTATDRAADLVRQLLAFSRRQILEMKVWDLNAILTNLHNMLRRLIGEDIELTTLLAEDLGRVKTDIGWIEQAIMNLVVNARDAMPSGGKLTIETGNAELDDAYVSGRIGVKPGRYVVLSVSDTGVGMTPEVRERLFEPFFSTKEKDKGTGLGLSTVYGIVKQSDGDIWVYSEPGKGSTFKIYLPRVDEPSEEPREKVSGDELLRGSERILLVEDEEDVRKLAALVLERQGYKVLAARDGDEALLVCERHKDPIHLMLTDVVMPGMGGHELAKRLESLHPEMKVLYMSGYTDDAIVLHGVLVEGVNYIQKPFTVDALTRKVREVLEQ